MDDARQQQDRLMRIFYEAVIDRYVAEGLEPTMAHRKLVSLATNTQTMMDDMALTMGLPSATVRIIVHELEVLGLVTTKRTVDTIYFTVAGVEHAASLPC